MFINLTQTAPILEHRECPKQLVLRVADCPDTEGIVFVVRQVAFRPVVEYRWDDSAVGRSLLLREYVIQPKLWPSEDNQYVFTGLSAAVGVRNYTINVRMTLDYDGKEWSLGVVHGEADNDGVMLWIPLPGYDPLCDDLTPIMRELAEDKEPPKPQKTAWERLKDD